MKGKCAGCKVCKSYLREAGSEKMRVLSIRWQPERGSGPSPDAGKTAQEDALREACAILAGMLAPEGIQVVMEIFPPTAAPYAPELAATTGIRIGDRPLEDWPGEDSGGGPLQALSARIVAAGRMAAEKLLQTEREISGCPAC